jgi:hypothetical protein
MVEKAVAARIRYAGMVTGFSPGVGKSWIGRGDYQIAPVSPSLGDAAVHHRRQPNLDVCSKILLWLIRSSSRRRRRSRFSLS